MWTICGRRSEKEKVSIDLAKKSYYPDLTFGVDYIVTGDSIMPSTQDGKCRKNIDVKVIMNNSISKSA